MISERTLKKWRKEALMDKVVEKGIVSMNVDTLTQLNKCILQMTQELLDLHLTRKK